MHEEISQNHQRKPTFERRKMEAKAVTFAQLLGEQCGGLVTSTELDWRRHINKTGGLFI